MIVAGHTGDTDADAGTGDVFAPDRDGTGSWDRQEDVEARYGWRYTLAQIRRDPTAAAGLVVVGVVTAVAAVAWIDAVLFDYLARFGFFAGLGVEQYALAKAVWTSPVAEPANTPRLLPPVGLENQFGEGTLAHPLGTDHRGRDILLRLIYGSRVAIQVGFVAAVVGLLGGTAVGAVAGYYGGRVDDVLMRFVETLYSIPFLVLVLSLVAVLGARENLTIIMLVVGVVYVPEFARLIRSRVFSVREEVYVEAARAAGVSTPAILRRHVIPNSFTPVLVQGTLRVGTAILTVAGLSFLGFGVNPPTPSWGRMLSVSRDYMIQNVWFSVWPGLAILLTVVGFNLFGDGLRDALDPRLKN